MDDRLSHVVEPYELNGADSAAYWGDVMRAARALAEVTRPRKLDDEIHGNTVEHLHTHLLPRGTSGETDAVRLAVLLRDAPG